MQSCIIFDSKFQKYKHKLAVESEKGQLLTCPRVPCFQGVTTLKKLLHLIPCIMLMFFLYALIAFYLQEILLSMAVGKFTLNAVR